MLLEDVMNSHNVSRETLEHLECYQALLVKWQRAINLVSGKTLPEAWERHFLDSAQLLQYIPKQEGILADIGSGAGFPGMVLSILNPDFETHLIESDEKKCQFLRTVSRETKTPVSIHTDRIENVYEDVQPDFVTARALASLEKLFVYVWPWAENRDDFQLIFLKGAQLEQEIEAAQDSFDFRYELFPSVTDPAAQIIRICDLKKTL